MADYSAEIAALDQAIALGATKVQYDNGRIVEYDTFEALLARRRFLIGLQESSTPLARPPRSAFAAFDRGDC
jgi:hypothetical protein